MVRLKYCIGICKQHVEPQTGVILVLETEVQLGSSLFKAEVAELDLVFAGLLLDQHATTLVRTTLYEKIYFKRHWNNALTVQGLLACTNPLIFEMNKC
jgi:hypothetical protein